MALFWDSPAVLFAFVERLSMGEHTPPPPPFMDMESRRQRQIKDTEHEGGSGIAKGLACMQVDEA